MRYCSSCGRSFVPARHYYHQCLECWRAENITAGPVSACTPSDHARIRQTGYEAGNRDGRSAAFRDRPEAIDGELILSVIKLTHPDKHPPERFAEANAVTARLLALREAAEVRR